MMMMTELAKADHQSIHELVVSSVEQVAGDDDFFSSSLLRTVESRSVVPWHPALRDETPAPDVSLHWLEIYEKCSSCQAIAINSAGEHGPQKGFRPTSHRLHIHIHSGGPLFYLGMA